MARLRPFNADTQAVWKEIENNYPSLVQHYEQLIASLMYGDYPNLSPTQTSAMKEELARILHESHNIIHFLNSRDVFSPKDAVERRKIEEVQPNVKGREETTPLSAEDFERELKAYRENFLKLGDDQRKLVVPYEPLPVYPAWYTTRLGKIALAAVAVVVVLFGLNFVYNAILNAIYKGGESALTADDYEGAIRNFSITKFFNYGESESRLRASYEQAVQDNIQERDFRDAQSYAQRYFDSDLNDVSALSAYHNAYYREAVYLSTETLVVAESTESPEAEAAAENPELARWRSVQDVLLSLRTELSGTFTERLEAKYPDSIPSNIASQLALNSDESNLLIQTFDERGAILLEAGEWQELNSLCTESNLPFTWEEAPSVRRLYLLGLQEEAAISFASDAPDGELIEGNLTELIGHISDDEIEYILSRLILSSRRIDAVLAILQAEAEGEESVKWNNARPLLSEARDILSTEALEAYYLGSSDSFNINETIAMSDYQAQRAELRLELDSERNRSRSIADFTNLLANTLTGLYFDSYYVPASEAFHNGDYATAQALFDELIENGGATYQDARVLRRDSYLVPATTAFDAAEYSIAESLLRVLYAYDEAAARPLFTQTLYNLGLEAIAAQDYEQAETYLEELRQIDAEFANLEVQLSSVYLQLGLSLMADSANPNRYEEARTRLHKLWEINPSYANTETLIRETYYQPYVLELAPMDANPDVAICSDVHERLSENVADEAFGEANSNGLSYPILYMGYRDTELLLNESLYCMARAELASASISPEEVLLCDNEAYQNARKAIQELGLGSNYRNINELIIQTFYEPALVAYRIAFFDETSSESERTAAIDCSRELLGQLRADDDLYLFYYQDASLLYYSSFYIPAYEEYLAAQAVLAADGYQASGEAWANLRDNSNLQFLISSDGNPQFAPPLNFTPSGASISLGQLLEASSFPTASEIYRDSYYLVGQAAFNASDWAAAQNAFFSLRDDALFPDAAYRDAALLLHQSYYIPGRAAFDIQDWNVARTNLEPLYFDLNAGDFRLDAAAPSTVTLLSDSYAIPSGEIYASLVTYDDPNWDSFLQNMERLIDIKRDYSEHLPYDAFTFLHEAYYQRASLAEVVAKDAGSSTETKVQAWTVVVDSLVALLLLDVDQNVAEPNLLFDVPSPYRDSQDRLRGVYHELAGSALLAGFWEQARGASLQLLSLDPNDELANQQWRDSYYLAGQAARSVQDWDTAITEFTALLLIDARSTQTNPFEVRDGYQDADELLLASYHDAAQEQLESQNYETVREITRQLLDLLPEDEQGNLQVRESYYLEGQSYLTNSEWQLARESFETLLRLDTPSGLNFLLSNENLYKDSATLYRETYYRPAQVELDAENWSSARNVLVPLLSLDPSDSRANDLVISSFMRPAESAIDLQNWASAQDSLDRLFANTNSQRFLVSGTLYDSAAALRLDAFLLPAQTAIDEGDWNLARQNALNAISRGESMLDSNLRLPLLDAKLNTAKTILGASYFSPVDQALAVQDWQTARAILRQLEADRSNNAFTSWYPNAESIADYQLRTYSLPVQAAIDIGDLALANEIIAELENNPLNAASVVTELRLRFYSKPLAESVAAEDWSSAADLYLALRNQSVFPSFLDAFLLDFPQVRSILVTESLAQWRNYDFTDVATRNISSADLTTVAINTSATRAYVGDSDGQIFALGLQNNLRTLYTIQTGRAFVRELVIDPRGEWIASAHDDSIVRIWSAESGQLLSELSVNDALITRIVTSFDAQFLAVGNEDGEVFIWETATWTQLRRVNQTGAISAIAFSPDNSLLVASGMGQIQLWPQDAPAAFTIEANSYVQNLLVYPDGQRFMVMGFSPTIQTWTMSGETGIQLQGHEDWVRGAIFGANEQVFVSLGADSRLILWDSLLGIPINQSNRMVESGYDLDWAVDGSIMLAAGEDGRLYVWQLND